MAAERHVILAGAGIAGLTAALALTRAGLRATVFEQAARLEETGAGIQLAPNATRVLIALGLRDRLAASVMTPQAIRVMAGGSGHEIVRIPLGDDIERRYGAPYWTVHRSDLQAALAAKAQTAPYIRLKLGTSVEDFVVDGNGVSVLSRGPNQLGDERGVALIGADGLWSTVGAKLHGDYRPRTARRTAWRALVPVEAVPAEFHTRLVHLWLGSDAHLVHYPVKGGQLINLVCIVRDEWNEQGWSAAGDRDEILHHFAGSTWAEKARALITLPERWLKWALFASQYPFRGGRDAVTLIGDAAHPMLPFLAQGAGMAIEDAAVIAAMLGKHATDPAGALRRYESARRDRTSRAQQVSRQQGRIYGLSGPEALLRNVAMRLMGGEKLRARYDWLYSWRAPEFIQNADRQL